VIVIDASVALKWIVAEVDTDVALALRSERVSAPDLLAECANALWKKVRRKELSTQEASLAARLLQRADIELEPMRDLIEPATRLAVALDHPAYDCLYLALAEVNESEFVTADETFCRKVRAAGLNVQATPLSAYRPN
jgi:predicted nucleic acid-binding protein